MVATGVQYTAPSLQVGPSGLAVFYPSLLWCYIGLSGGKECRSDKLVVVVEILIFDTISSSCPNSILGMHIFGCKFSLRTDTGDTVPDRKNFDSLLWAIVTVFQVNPLCSLQVGQGKVKRIRGDFSSCGALYWLLTRQKFTQKALACHVWRKNNYTL